MSEPMLVESEALGGQGAAVIVDCRFSLADPGEGRRLYDEGHIPGARYLDLNRDLSAPPGRLGGRHPLPRAEDFLATLAALGIAADTEVIAYDDSRLAFAARLWWLMRSIGYRAPRLLNGGYRAYLDSGAEVERTPVARPAVTVPAGVGFSGFCDFEGLRQAQSEGALLVDSREAPRYQGLEEPIDPVAGHIPGAINRPWQQVTDGAGRVLDEDALRSGWGDALDARELVVYCGSGVTACVNLFSLALLGRGDAILYAGSWSDWCSRLEET